MAEKRKKDSEKKTKKIRKISAPFLKNLLYKKGRIHRYVSNYAENLSDSMRFSVVTPRKRKIDFERQQEIEANKEVEISEEKVKSKKKKKWLNFVYFALNIAVIAVVLLVQLSGERNPFESLTAILDVNWWFILAAVGTVALGVLCDQIRFTSLIHNTTGIFRFNLAFKVGIVGKYYDVITPLSTGGQPFSDFVY